VIEHQHKLDIRVLTIGSLKPYARNPRTHSDKQINQIANNGASGTSIVASRSHRLNRSLKLSLVMVAIKESRMPG
jgi:hypothetical protein